MPTNLMGNSIYHILDVWLMCCKGSRSKQRGFVVELFRRLKEFQSAKRVLFRRDSKGNLPLVTKELAQNVCEKYDGLLPLQRKCGSETIPPVSPYGLCNRVDELIEELKREDATSVLFLKEHFCERTGYTPRLGNIRDMERYCHFYPFHTPKATPHNSRAQIARSKISSKDSKRRRES